MAQKIKLSKKQIKQPDEFLTMTDKALEYLTDHLNEAIAVVAAVIIALVAGFGVRYWMESNQDKATASFNLALAVLNTPLTEDLTDEQILAGFTSYDSEEQRKTVAAFKLEDAISTYKGSKSALEGRYYLAGLYYDKGNYSKALENYEIYLKKTAPEPLNDPIFMSLIDLNLASCYYNLGNHAKALEYYKKVIDSPDSPNRAEALVNAARCEEKLGRLDVAAGYLEQAEVESEIEVENEVEVQVEPEEEPEE
jgi:tetratricopeptide (TPR) repeat protein